MGKLWLGDDEVKVENVFIQKPQNEVIETNIVRFRSKIFFNL